MWADIATGHIPSFVGLPASADGAAEGRVLRSQRTGISGSVYAPSLRLWHLRASASVEVSNGGAAESRCRDEEASPDRDCWWRLEVYQKWSIWLVIGFKKISWIIQESGTEADDISFKEDNIVQIEVKSRGNGGEDERKAS